jgi:hypothetical protein
MNSVMRFEAVQVGGCDLGRMDWTALFAAIMYCNWMAMNQNRVNSDKKEVNFVFQCLGLLYALSWSSLVRSRHLETATIIMGKFCIMDN